MSRTKIKKQYGRYKAKQSEQSKYPKIEYYILFLTDGPSSALQIVLVI